MKSDEKQNFCCGEIRDSAFCPQCGRALVCSNAGYYLLKYLSAQLAHYVTRRETIDLVGNLEPENVKNRKRQSLDRGIRKFSAYRNFVISSIKNGVSTPIEDSKDFDD